MDGRWWTQAEGKPTLPVLDLEEHQQAAPVRGYQGWLFQSFNNTNIYILMNFQPGWYIAAVKLRKEWHFGFVMLFKGANATELYMHTQVTKVKFLNFIFIITIFFPFSSLLLLFLFNKENDEIYKNERYTQENEEYSTSSPDI